MPLKLAINCFLFIGTLTLCISCNKTRYTIGPNTCPDEPFSLFDFVVVNRDSQSVFADTINVPRIYYFKNGAKNYISDVSIAHLSSLYKYNFFVVSENLLTVGVDSNVQDFYLQRVGGIIDTLNIITKNFNAHCIDDFGVQYVSCQNGSAFFDSSSNTWVVKEK